MLPPDDGSRGRLARRIRRSIAALVLIALAALFLHLLLGPFWHPTLHPLFATSGSYEPRRIEPLAFAAEDAALVLEPLAPADPRLGRPAVRRLQNLDDLARLETDFDALPAGMRDLQIVYLGAHGVVVDGEAVLLCHDFDPQTPEAARFRLASVLDRLERSSAGAKLLILDAGRIDYEPRLGLLVNEFPRRVIEELRGRNDARLWVLLSHAPLERAFTMADRKRSAFAHFLAAGLNGEADQNADGLLDLAELAGYVRSEVSGYVAAATAGRLTQTPLLLQAGVDPPDLTRAPVLRAVGGLDLSAAAEAAKKARSAAPAGAAPAATPSTNPGSPSGSTSGSPDSKTSSGGPSGASGGQPASGASERESPAPAGTSERPSDAAPTSPAAPPCGADDPPASPDSTAPSPAAKASLNAPPPAAAPPDSTKSPGSPPTPASPAGPATALGPAPVPAAQGASNSAPPPVRRASLPPVGASLADTLRAAAEAAEQFEARDVRRGAHPLRLAAPAWRAWRERQAAYAIARRSGDDGDSAATARAARADLAVLLGLPLEDPTELPPPSLVGLAVLHARPPVDPLRLPTWAMVERTAAESSAAPPVAVAALVEKLDALFARPELGPVRDALRQGWTADAERYAELRFARRLASLPDLPAGLGPTAWSVRREAERTAASPWSTVAWIRPLIAQADAERLAGEREMRDRLDGAWADRAGARLRRARQGYQEASRAIEQVEAAVETYDRLLDRVDRYLAWHHAAAGDLIAAPAFEDLSLLFDRLEELAELLRSIDERDLASVANLRDQLEIVRGRVEAAVDPAALAVWLSTAESAPGAAWRAQVLLASRLAPVRFLPKLEALAQRGTTVNRPPAEQGKATPAAPASSKLLAADDWRQAVRQLALEWRFARLAGHDLDPAVLERLRNAVQAIAPDALDGPAATAPRADEATLWKLFRDAGEAVGQIRESIPRRAVEGLARYGDLRDPESRPQKLAALRAVDELVRLIDPRDVARLGDADVAERLRRAAWYDRFAGQRRRALESTADAPTDELNEALTEAAFCRRLAQDLPGEPPLADDAAPLPTIDGTTELALVTEPARDWKLRFRPAPGQSGKVWLLLAYDPSVLVVDVADVPAYSEFELSDKLARSGGAIAGEELLAGVRRGDYPIDPRRLALTPSWEFAGGAARDVRLTVRRKSSVGRPTRVIAKFVGPDFYVRHEASVLLSTLDAVQLTPVAFPGGWSRNESTLVLHPLPNQKTDYRFTLQNLGDSDKTVDVELVAPRQPLVADSILSLPPQDALDALGPTTRIAFVPQLKLPAGGEAVPLAPPAESGAASAPGAPAAKPPGAKATDPAAADLPPPPLPGDSIANGLILIVRDAKEKQTTFRKIEIRPLRPRAYLTADVGYDLEQQRIEILVKPRDKTLIPPEGLEIRCETPEPLAAGAEARLEAVLAPPQYEARLYVRLPAEAGRVQPLAISVHGYPRAFFFQVPCGVPSSNLPESDDVLAVRVVTPKSGKWYKAPVDSIPVRVEVDAPRGAFDNGRDRLDVGLDVDRDRDFRGETTLPFHSDRQAEVATTGFLGQVLSVETRVGDFRFDLPTGGLQNVRANVLGRIQVGSRYAYSLPVEVLLDGAPPVVRRVQLPAGAPPTVGGSLEVIVAAVDGEMSGVDKVEVGFDPRFEGQFGGGAAPLPATPGEPTVWKVKLPVQGVEPGPAQILIRATDKAGNVGEYTKLQVNVLPPAVAPDGKPTPPPPGRIQGRVRYGERPIPGAEVTLEGPADPRTRTRPVVARTTTDAQGAFALADVPPGKYQLKARGLANNRTRVAVQETTVVSPPGAPADVVLQAK